jgi:hypothetical protein
MQEDPRLNRNEVHFPRLNIYEENHVLSATIHQDIKRPLFLRCQSGQLRALDRSQMKFYALC